MEADAPGTRRLRIHTKTYDEDNVSDDDAFRCQRRWVDASLPSVVFDSVSPERPVSCSREARVAIGKR